MEQGGGGGGWTERQGKDHQQSQKGRREKALGSREKTVDVKKHLKRYRNID
jgi:hypothetical protein